MVYWLRRAFKREDGHYRFIALGFGRCDGRGWSRQGYMGEKRQEHRFESPVEHRSTCGLNVLLSKVYVAFSPRIPTSTTNLDVVFGRLMLGARAREFYHTTHLIFDTNFPRLVVRVFVSFPLDDFLLQGLIQHKFVWSAIQTTSPSTVRSE